MRSQLDYRHIPREHNMLGIARGVGLDVGSSFGVLFGSGDFVGSEVTGTSRIVSFSLMIIGVGFGTGMNRKIVGVSVADGVAIGVVVGRTSDIFSG